MGKKRDEDDERLIEKLRKDEEFKDELKRRERERREKETREGDK